MAKVNFYQATLAQYTSLETKDANSLYFVTDAKRIYKGDVDVTQTVVPVTAFPDTGVTEKLYVNTTTFEVKIYENGAWVVVSPGYITTLEAFKSADNASKIANISATKAYIAEQLAVMSEGAFLDAKWDASEGNVAFYGSDTQTPVKSVNLTGLAHGITYDSENLKITVPMYGEASDLEINIPKDFFLQDGYYDPQYVFNPERPDEKAPAIVLVVKTEDPAIPQKTIAIPASALVNDYSGGTSANIKVEINDNHEIIATLVVSGTTSVDGEVVILKSDNTVSKTGVTINTTDTAEMGESNTSIPTAKIIAAAIKTACDEVKTHVLSKGDADKVVISTNDGIVRSAKTLGGATLGANPSENVLATEAAVVDAISWKTLA